MTNRSDTPQDLKHLKSHPHTELNEMLAESRFLAHRIQITEALEWIVEECRGTNRPDGYLISERTYAAVKAALAKAKGQ